MRLRHSDFKDFSPVASGREAMLATIANLEQSLANLKASATAGIAVREVQVPVIKEVIKIQEVVKEIIKEVPVEKTVIKEVVKSPSLIKQEAGFTFSVGRNGAGQIDQVVAKRAVGAGGVFITFDIQRDMTGNLTMSAVKTDLKEVH